jgi:hypothetical protein
LIALVIASALARVASGADATTITTTTAPAVTKFDGTANRFIEGGGEKAQIRISGTFCLDAALSLDLSTTTVRLDQLLDEGESGGAGELLDIVPLTLSAVPRRSTPNSARYECLAPACDRAATPSLEITAKASGKCRLAGGAAGTAFEFLLDINRGDTELRIPPRYSASPAACSGNPPVTRLTTRFTINPSAAAVVVIRPAQVWRCNRSQGVVGSLRTLRSGATTVKRGRKHRRPVMR